MKERIKTSVKDLDGSCVNVIGLYDVLVWR